MNAIRNAIYYAKLTKECESYKKFALPVMQTSDVSYYNAKTKTVYFVEKYSSEEHKYDNYKSLLSYEIQYLYLAITKKAEAARPATIYIQKIQRGRIVRNSDKSLSLYLKKLYKK
jgi:hypothetical protein